MKNLCFAVFALFIFVSCSSGSNDISDNDTAFSDSEQTDDLSYDDNSTVDESAENELSDDIDDLSDDISDEVSDTETEVLTDDDDSSENDLQDGFQTDSDEITDEDVDDDHVEVIDNEDGSVTVNVTLNSEYDAAESYLMDAGTSSWNYFYGSFLNIGFREYDMLEELYVAYHAAFRFTDVDVPAGSTIEKAELSFHPTNEVDSSQKVYLRLSMEKTGDSEPFNVFDYESGRPDQRPETDAVEAEWLLKCQAIEDCYDPESSYCKQRALDCWDRSVRYTVPKPLTEMVSEIIDSGDWQRDNSMTVFITGTYPSMMSDEEKPDYSNYRAVTGFDTEKGSSFYPVLSITFTVK